MVQVREDLTGRRFGLLTVIEQAEDYIEPNGKHRAAWLCECSCNNHNRIIVSQRILKTGGDELSCGCYKTKRGRYCTKKKFNQYEIDGDIVRIKLSNCDQYAIIDLDKWEEIPYIKELLWGLNNSGYVRAYIPKSLQANFNNKTHVTLHRLICPCEDGFEPDHLDRDKLNNRNENLIPKTHIMNSINMSKSKNNKSGIIGVTWRASAQQWIAQIVVNKKYIYLYRGSCKEDAIRARLNAEWKYYKEDAPQKYLFEKYNIQT
jgi:hypothetical protein